MPNKFLLLILAIFLLTRLFQLTSNPASLYWDEASIGYNAYSILTTGKDEWGTPFPVHFRAFGEFKLPVYIYTVSIFESFLGLSELAVRLPAVLYALGTLILTYLLGKKLFSETIGLLSAFILTLMPWYFLISRVGYEANAGLMFFLLGLYLWIIKDQRTWFIIISVLSFILSMYSYNSFRIISPLTTCYLLVFDFGWRSMTKRKMGMVVISGLLLAGAVAQIVRFTLSAGGTNRFDTIGIFHGNWSEITATFIKNYLSHLSPDFLFIHGDINLRSHIGFGGELYWAFLPFLIFGLWYLVKEKKYLPLFIILISIIPAAITRESPHSLRTITLVPFLSIIIAMGIVYLQRRLPNWRRFDYSLPTLMILIAVFFGINYHYFLNVYPDKSKEQWQYQYKQIFTNKDNQFSEYDHIVISDSEAQPYVFALFYLKYDPNKFRDTVEYNPPDKWGFSTVRNFDKFVFLNLKRDSLPKGRNLIL